MVIAVSINPRLTSFQNVYNKSLNGFGFFD
jgi:hypothetical protein